MLALDAPASNDEAQQMLAIEDVPAVPKKEKKKKKGAHCPWNMKENKCNNKPGCKFDKTKGKNGKCVRDKVVVDGKAQEIGLGSIEDLKGQLLALEAPQQDMMELD